MKNTNPLTRLSLNVRGLMVAGALLGAPVVALHAADPAPIYAGAQGGWTTQAWGGVTIQPDATTVKVKGGESLVVKVDADSKPYAGVSFVAGASNATALTDALRAKGVVTLYVKIGTDASGNPGAMQDVQFCLAFKTPDGKTVFAPFTSMTTLKPEGSGDAAAPGWHVIKLPIASALEAVTKGGTVPMASVSGINIQFLDKPQAGFFIGEALVKTE